MTIRGNHNDPLRVIPFERGEGAYQLAVTEAVLDAVGRGEAPPTLRAYSWARDALVLGVGQTLEGIDLEACRLRDCAVLRRNSGGTGVVHDRQTLSFQLVLPAGHPNLTDDIHANYRLIAGIVIDMLATFGIPGRWATLAEARADTPPPGLEPICFSSLAPFEVLAGERKLVGLAQVRRRSATALQGMLYLRFEPSKTVALLDSAQEFHGRLSTLLAERTTDLETEAGETVTALEVAGALARATEAKLGVEMSEAPLTARETEAAMELERTKYTDPGWIFRR